MSTPYYADDDEPELIHFLPEFENTDVGAVTIDGAPWLIANHVTRVLGLGDEAEDLPRHMRCHVPWGAHDRPTVALSEAGVHRLARRSELPVADRFSDWIVEEGFPTLRGATDRDTAAAPQRTSRTRRRAGRTSTRGRAVA